MLYFGLCKSHLPKIFPKYYMFSQIRTVGLFSSLEGREIYTVHFIFIWIFLLIYGFSRQKRHWIKRCHTMTLYLYIFILAISYIRRGSEKENNRISNIPLSCTYDLELLRDFTDRIKTNNEVRKKEHVVDVPVYVAQNSCMCMCVVSCCSITCNSKRRKSKGKWLVKCQHWTSSPNFYLRSMIQPILSNGECPICSFYTIYSYLCFVKLCRIDNVIFYV